MDDWFYWISLVFACLTRLDFQPLDCFLLPLFLHPFLLFFLLPLGLVDSLSFVVLFSDLAIASVFARPVPLFNSSGQRIRGIVGSAASVLATPQSLVL